MSLEVEELKELNDKAYNSGQVTRERGSDDIVFYHITHWDENALNESDLAYRGEFDILKKAGRQIISDLDSNPIQVDFEPREEASEGASELLDGIYRRDDSDNQSVEAYENAKMETVVCGVGAWELYTEYVSLKSGNRNQVIKRRPIQEANNNTFWDPNAKLMDKSDADYVSTLTPFSEDGYRQLVKDLTGEDRETISMQNFKFPEQSYAFPWISGEGKKIYVTRFYHREKVKSKILTMTDPLGETIQLRESDLKQVMDEMLDAGFSIEDEKTIEEYKITLYIASGAEILYEGPIAGENIPVIPMYGEYAYVEGEVHYEGVTRCAKDPSRLRDFQLSYLADIVSRSPRPKPIMLKEQIAGYEDMYQETGSENHYPFLLQNWKDVSGNELPIGPIAQMPDQPIPQALIASIDLSRQAVEDVANPGNPQDIADPDISGKAVLALQARLDMQSMIYQKHYKHAKRRDAEVYAGMAAVIQDVPRKVKTQLPDGSVKEVQVMQKILDEETGDIVTINDLRGAEFDVTSRIGSDYKTQKDQTIERLGELTQGMDPGDPMRKALQLKTLVLMDGVDFDDIRDYANKQLVISGFKEPETDEEIQMMEQLKAQPQQPDAQMVLAMAEMKKGEADQMSAENDRIKLAAETQNEQVKRLIDKFEAQTDRMEAQVDAHKAGADIDNKQADTFGKQIDNAGKVIQLRAPAEMSDDELYEQVING